MKSCESFYILYFCFIKENVCLFIQIVWHCCDTTELCICFSKIFHVLCQCWRTNENVCLSMIFIVLWQFCHTSENVLTVFFSMQDI